MQHHEHDSPLPPDPVGREDIMSDDPREGCRPGRAGRLAVAAP